MTKINWKEVEKIAPLYKVTAKIQGAEHIVTIHADGEPINRIVETQTVEEAYMNYFKGQKEILGQGPKDLHGRYL